jgi:hypothetical protein
MITPPPLAISPTAVQEVGEGQETALSVVTPLGIVGLVQSAPPSTEARSRGSAPGGVSPPTATHVLLGAHESPFMTLPDDEEEGSVVGEVHVAPPSVVTKKVGVRLAANPPTTQEVVDAQETLVCIA